jgi:nicotinic acid mononucleotide adenylyltransferase
MPLRSAAGEGSVPEHTAGLYALPAIFALRDHLATLDPSGEPRAIIACRARPPGAIGILAGSFDPLTNAHVALAAAALEHGDVAAVYFALSRHTVDKEARQRPTDTDRALALQTWLRGRERYGLLLFNRGLYADQALAARAAFPRAEAIRFIVGFDKARQIFDPRYYGDRDGALRTLFGAVDLLVAPRAGASADELDDLLSRPENRPFRAAARALPFEPTHADASSTIVRDAFRAGRPVDHLVPPEALAFVRELAPYAPPSADPTTPDRYVLREALVAALAADRAWAERHADLRALLDRAAAATADGAALRAWLATSEADRVPPTLRELLATPPLE